MFQVKKEGSKQNILVSDFRKMFARQISKVQLHRNLMLYLQLFNSKDKVFLLLLLKIYRLFYQKADMI